MEAKTKIIAAVAVIVMCAAGLVGAGYAYTASTVNDGNSATAEYIQIHQDGDGAYTFTTDAAKKNIKWDTSDYKIDTTIYTDFSLSGSSEETIATVDYNLVQIGDDITLMFDQTGGTIVDTLDCIVSGQGFTYNGAYALFIKVETGATPTETWMMLVGNDTFKTYSAPAWSGDAKFDVEVDNTGTPVYYDATVSVFFGLPASPGYITQTHAQGTPATGPAVPFTDATLIFRIATNSEVAPTVTLNKDAIGLTVGGTQTLTATVNNSTNQHVFWESSDVSIATVSAEGLVTGVAAGEATITAYSADGHAFATCTVTVAGIVLDATAVTGKIAGNVFTINASLYGTTVGDIEWTVSPAGYVTIVQSGSHNAIATVTVVNGEASTITATVTIDSVAYNATCTVNAA